MPSRRDTYRRERPPQRRGGGWDTRWDTPPLAEPRQRLKRGGRSRLSLSAGAVRVGRSRTNNPNNDSEQWKGGMGHPPAVFGTAPRCPRPVCPATQPATERGTERGHHQIATSGVVSRTVGQIVKRSIAPRAVALVGVPSGSCCNNSRRSAALSNPPAARKRSRLPAVIACSSRAISWRISGSALVGPAGSAAPWPSPSWVQLFRTGAARSAAATPVPTATT